MKYFYEVQTYYSGWWQDSYYSNKKQAVQRANYLNNRANRSVRIVKNSLNTSKFNNVTIFEKENK